jgi:hypothetical protein
MNTILLILWDIKEDWRFYLVSPIIIGLAILANHGSVKAETWMYQLNDLTLK